MHIELLYDPDCSSPETALARVRRVLETEGVAFEITVTAVTSQEQAVANRFLGSPTIRIGGADIEPGSEGRDDYALTCRAYRRVDGRITPTPPEQLIRDAVRRARHP